MDIILLKGDGTFNINLVAPNDIFVNETSLSLLAHNCSLARGALPPSPPFILLIYKFYMVIEVKEDKGPRNAGYELCA